MKSSYTRLFLIISLLLMASLVLVACSPAAQPAEEEPAMEEPAEEEPAEETGGGIQAVEATATPVEIEVSAYGEAPMLAEMVAAGSLPVSASTARRR